jgi:hypothetical protein
MFRDCVGQSKVFLVAAVLRNFLLVVGRYLIIPKSVHL